MKFEFIKLALACNFLFLSTSGLCQWTEIGNAEGLSEIIAHDLAYKLVPRLNREGSKVVFLNLSKCSIGFIVSDSWCEVFKNELETALVSRGIVFLNEKDQKSVREKIALEQAYQMSSMQVDITKAVELGKQHAFQAYVNLDVFDAGSDKVRVAASSVNIRDGVTTISEKSSITVRKEKSRSMMTWVFGLGGLVIGTGVSAASYITGSNFDSQADKKYLEYKSATTPDQATQKRNELDSLTKKRDQEYTLSGIAATVAIAGGWYFMAAAKTVSLYKFDLADGVPLTGGPDLGRTSIDIVPVGNGLGVALSQGF